MTKTLFDHINQITAIQSPRYWSTLSDGDKKTFTPYMINRFLSMEQMWCDVINDIQLYSLPPKVLYKLYSNLLPKGKIWLKYIKRRRTTEYPRWLIELISKYYEISNLESEEYLALFYKTSSGKAELKEIVELYGTDPKLVKKLRLE